VYGQSRQQGIVLVGEAYHALEFLIANSLAIEIEIATHRSDLVLASEYVQERGLSSSRRTHDSHELSRMDRPRYARQDSLSVEVI
jgi:hypothetical protein